MKRIAILALLCLLVLALAACGSTGEDTVYVPGSGIIPNPDSNMFKDPPVQDKGESEDEALANDAKEQESMAGNKPIYLPVVPVTPDSE